MTKKKEFVWLKIIACMVMVVMNSAANAQLLSFDTCLQLFVADSANFEKLKMERDFVTKSRSINGMFVRELKSKTDERVTMMKAISVDTTNRHLLYNFRDKDQYRKLKSDLEAGKFERGEAGKQMIEGKINIKNTYRLGEILIRIRREENHKTPDEKYSLIIRSFGKK